MSIPNAEDLFAKSVEIENSPELMQVPEDKRREMVFEIEKYTVENVKNEAKKIYIDILAELEDQAGTAGGVALADDEVSRNAFSSMFSQAYDTISYN